MLEEFKTLFFVRGVFPSKLTEILEENFFDYTARRIEYVFY